VVRGTVIELTEIGTRVVIRYRLPDGRATDALGPLIEAHSTYVVVETKRGAARIERSTILAAKPVPPAPDRKAARSVRPLD
jgi:hypothetical protein